MVCLPGGETIDLPTEAFDVLLDALRALSEGDRVRVVREAGEVTSQDAAELLGVSRPYLIKLLDAGEIPHCRGGVRTAAFLLGTFLLTVSAAMMSVERRSTR